jgi:hypothetical protein
MDWAAVMIHHEGTKDTKGAWKVEGFGTRSHHQVSGVVRVQGALPVRDPFVPFVPSW